MKIFLSWSGQQSRQIAEMLKAWLPSVLQTADVWMSAKDIQSGERGLNAIASSLSERGYGVLVLTDANFDAPWVLFEAGALSNTMPGRVAPLLCGMADLALVSSPLNQFQYNKFDKEGVRKLVKDINAASESIIEDGRLHATFEKWWPDLEEQYLTIPADDAADHTQPNDQRQSNVETALDLILTEIKKQQVTLNQTNQLLAIAGWRAAQGVIPNQPTLSVPGVLAPDGGYDFSGKNVNRLLDIPIFNDAGGGADEAGQPTGVLSAKKRSF